VVGSRRRRASLPTPYAHFSTRKLLASALQPTKHHHCSFTDFLTLSIDDVITAVSDPLPISLLRENIDALAPFLVELFNWSLLPGIVPTSFKSA
jgi:hypothetical protein